MATRTFKIRITNKTDKELLWSFDHLCGGVWSGNPLPPPRRIGIRRNSDDPEDAVHGVATFQAESDGIATGTEGYVKYKIPRLDERGNDASDTLYIYWDNPIMGVTGGKCIIGPGTDVTPDCDYDDPPANTFPIPTPYRIAMSETEGPSGDEEMIALIPVVPIPYIWLGAWTIRDHPYVQITVFGKANDSTT